MMILYICFAICAVAGMFLFSGNMIVCALVLAASVVGIIFRLRQGGRGKNAVCLALAAACFVICFVPVNGADASVSDDYDSQISKALKAISNENYDKAETIRQELDETYGVSDDSLFVKAGIEMGEGDYAAAADTMQSMESRNTNRWYLVMETVYLEEDTTEASAALNEMYLEAADNLCENSYWQFMAGLVRLDEEADASARYYLGRAWALDDSNVETAYYLGVAYYREQDYDTAKYYFNEALKLEPDEEIQQQIKWYGEQMESES